MAISKEKKKDIIEKVSDAVKNSESVVFLNFHGLTVSDTGEMRKTLRNNGVNYTVAKKTLVKNALSNSDIKGDLPSLDGELALVYGNDLLTPAREANVFIKRFKDSLSILGGIFEGRYMDKGEMVNVAEIPPIDILYAQLANVISSPIQGLVMALDQIAEAKNQELGIKI